MISPELPGIKGLCTQVTAFSDEPTLRSPATDLVGSGMEASPSSACPGPWRRRGSGWRPPMRWPSTPTWALLTAAQSDPDPRAGETSRFGFKCRQGATYGMTRLLCSDHRGVPPAVRP